MGRDRLHVGLSFFCFGRPDKDYAVPCGPAGTGHGCKRHHEDKTQKQRVGHLSHPLNNIKTMKNTQM